LNLLRALVRVDAQNEYLPYTWEPTTLTEVGSPRFHPVLLPASPRWTWTPLVFPRDLARRRADVAHVQYFIPPSAPCPVITTIHDVAFRRFPALFPLKHRLLLNLLIPSSARNAAAVITGSEATRRDLMELYDLPSERIVVTPYAADPIYRPMDVDEARRAVKERFRIRAPYLLSVGVLQPRKNLVRLVRAFNRIARDIPHRLVLVGKEGWAGEELRRAIAESPAGREPVFTGYVPDADLPALYAGADIFVYPSLYEGFGLPPLEAMACGAPVITSNTSSLPEVVGNAGVTVNPLDTDALARAITDLLQDEARRSALRAAGLQRAGQFHWDHTARATIEVYRRVVAAAEAQSSSLKA
jgi:glycosyltransferase involved in cell wall biosynthesis